MLTEDPEYPGRFEAQVKECSDTAASRYAFDQLSYCDDAGDCQPGAVCCSDQMWGDSGVAQCRPLPPDGRNPCGFYELCVEGTPCGTPGTVCRAGSCKLAVVDLSCGAQRCTSQRPICCSSEDGGLECVPDEDEACSTNAGRLKVECRSRADCPGGMPCCSGVIGTYCAGECINAGYACSAAADCPPEDLGVKLNGCVATPPDERPPHHRCDYGP